MKFTAKLASAALGVLVCLSATALVQAQEEEWLCDRAKPVIRPEGAPGASDVTMRSVRIHPQDDDDSRDTWDVLSRFHVTHLEWTYLTDKPNDLQFVKRVKDR